MSAPSDDGAASTRKPFLRAATLVSLITLVSRFLGLARDIVIATCLGAGSSSAIFLIAFLLPNMARSVLGEGSLSAFIVPIYTRIRADEGKEAAWRFANNALTGFTFFTLALTALGILFSRPLFNLMGGDAFIERGQLDAVEQGVRLTRIMFPFLMLLSLSSILMGLCHAVRHFSTPALGSVMLNLTMIAAGLVFYRHGEATISVALAYAVLLGGLLRGLIMIPPLSRAGLRYRFIFEPRSSRMRRLYLMLLPATYGLAVTHINILVSIRFANHLDEAFVASLTFSQRLVQFPLAIIAGALATAILPQLSDFDADKRQDDLRQLAQFAFRIILIIFTPAALGLIILGQPLIEMFYEHGKWDARATLFTYQALSVYAPGILFAGMLRILTPIYYARHDVRTPVKIAFVSMLTNIALNCIFMKTPIVRETLGIRFLPLSYIIANALNAALLIWILHRRGLTLWNRQLTATALRAALAAAIMGAVAWLLWNQIGLKVAEIHKALSVAALIATILLSTGVYFISAHLLGVQDLRQAMTIIAKRGKK